MKIVKYIEYSEETLNSKFSPKKICESTEANFKLAWHLPFDLDEWQFLFNDILKIMFLIWLWHMALTKLKENLIFL